MRFSFGDATDQATVHDAQQDGHFAPSAKAIGRLRIELIARTSMRAAGIDGASMAAQTMTIARSHRSSLLQPGRYLRARDRWYRIDQVIEERDGLMRYMTCVLTEVQ